MEIQTWIVGQIRNEDQKLTLRSYPGVPCANLDCLKDAEILGEVGEGCKKQPGRSLSDVVFDTGFLLTMIKVDQDFRDKNK